MKEKTLKIIRIIISILIIIFVVLQLTRIIPNADNIFMPMLGILMLMQTIEYWEKNKEIALLSLIAAIIILLGVVLRIIR